MEARDWKYRVLEGKALVDCELDWSLIVVVVKLNQGNRGPGNSIIPNYPPPL